MYIHNKAGDFNGELVFGHGEAEEIDPKPSELDEFGNSNRTIFTDAEDAARAVFSAFYKNTNKVIKEHNEYFIRIAKSNKIMVLGHSLNNVDWPYFQLVSKIAPSASWAISYYNEEEKESNRKKAAEMLNLDINKINMIKIDDLC